MTVGCHPSLPTQYRAAPRLYLALRRGVLRHAGAASQPAHAEPEGKQHATRGSYEHDVEAGERQAPGAVRLRDAAGTRVLDHRAGIVVAAAVVDLGLDDPARLRVAGLGGACGHGGGSAEKHQGADRAGQELLAESHLVGLPTTVWRPYPSLARDPSWVRAYCSGDTQ